VKPSFASCLAKMYAANVPPTFRTEVLSVGSRGIGPTGTDRTAAYRLVVRYRSDAGRENIVYRTVVFLSSGRGLAHLDFADVDHEGGCAGLSRLVARRLIDASHG
jgi:hypothetical protein